MIRLLAFLVVVPVAIVGCTNHESTQASVVAVILPGMDYAEARDMLVSAGLEERRQSLWSILPPDDVNVITFFLDDKTALLVYVAEETGEIESLWKKDIAPPGEVYGKMHELDSFSVNTKRPGSKKTDASDGK